MVGGETIKRALSETTYLKTPICIDFSRDFHKNLFNWEELGGTIVDYTQEGIPLVASWDNGKAFKFEVKAGETKWLRIPTTAGNHGVAISLEMYMTGDVQATAYGAWMGTSPVCNVNDSWAYLAWRSDFRGSWVKFTATNGGTVYISTMSIYSLNLENSEVYEEWSYPNQTLDGITTYTYVVAFIATRPTLAQLLLNVAGDGTNPINISVKLNTLDGVKEIATISTTSATLTNYAVYIPLVVGNYANISFGCVTIEVRGNGTFKYYRGARFNMKEFVKRYNGYVEVSASNTSTTVTTYTLIDNNGKGNFYKDFVADITIASGGGSVELLINGKSVGTYTTSQTVDLYFFENEPIWKVEAKIAGDGTNPSSVKIYGHEFEGWYIVSR